MWKFQFRLKWLFCAMLVVVCLAYSWSMYSRHKAQLRRERQEQLEELRASITVLKAELKKKEEQFQVLQGAHTTSCSFNDLRITK